jgi:uncharacterized protein (DUF433 family)
LKSRAQSLRTIEAIKAGLLSFNPGPRWTSEQLADIRRRLQTDEPQVKIAADYGVRPAVISKLRFELELPPRRTFGLTAEEIESAAEAYRSGTTLAELRRQFHVSYATLRDALEGVGVTIRTRRKRQKFTKSQKRTFIREYRAGSTVEQIAARHSITEYRIRDVLLAEGEPRGKPGPPPKVALTAQQVEQVLARYAAGEPVHEIAKRFGITANRVWREARLAGAAVRPTKRAPVLTDQQAMEVAAAYRAGTRVQDLAQQYGVSRTAIYGALRRQGAPVGARRGRPSRRTNR